MLVIDLTPRFSNCCICKAELVNCKCGIPMYEGCAVPVEWDGEWGGMDACNNCFNKYSENKIPYWPSNPNTL